MSLGEQVVRDANGLETPLDLRVAAVACDQREVDAVPAAAGEKGSEVQVESHAAVAGDVDDLVPIANGDEVGHREHGRTPLEGRGLLASSRVGGRGGRPDICRSRGRGRRSLLGDGEGGRGGEKYEGEREETSHGESS